MRSFKPPLFRTCYVEASRIAGARCAAICCLKERELSILGNMGGKRPSAVKYRTVDGNHPAPFPDMTDEQLYNYEMAFNVPRKTFDKPPRPAQPEPAAHSEEKTERNEKVFDAPRYTARATRPEPPARFRRSVGTRGPGRKRAA